MTAESLFSLANALVLPQWLLLIVAPRWKWTQKLANSYLIPLVLAALYAYLLVAHAGETEGGGFGSLAEVKNLFANDFVLLGGWVHYLAFDLLVGTWIVNNAQQSGVRHWLLIPCLIFTFMLGPTGFLLYQLIKRLTLTKPVVHHELS